MAHLRVQHLPLARIVRLSSPSGSWNLPPPSLFARRRLPSFRNRPNSDIRCESTVICGKWSAIWKGTFSKPVWTELFLVDSSISLSFWFFRRFVVIESCDIRGLMDVHSLPRFRYSYQCYTWLSCTTCLYRSSLFSRWRFVWIQSQYVWIFLKKIILLFFSINWFTWCEIFVEIIAK